jgi:hypothetical protein
MKKKGKIKTRSAGKELTLQEWEIGLKKIDNELDIRLADSGELFEANFLFQSQILSVLAIDLHLCSLEQVWRFTSIGKDLRGNRYFLFTPDQDALDRLKNGNQKYDYDQEFSFDLGLTVLIQGQKLRNDKVEVLGKVQDISEDEEDVHIIGNQVEINKLIKHLEWEMKMKHFLEDVEKAEGETNIRLYRRPRSEVEEQFFNLITTLKTFDGFLKGMDKISEEHVKSRGK